MPKNIIFESFKHQLLTSARNCASGNSEYAPADLKTFSRFINSLQFEEIENSQAKIRWNIPTEGEFIVKLKGDVEYYFRGDNERSVKTQEDMGLKFTEIDSVAKENSRLFEEKLRMLCEKASLPLARNGGDAKTKSLLNEEDFHDGWAEGENVDDIDVYKANEAPTAPEMRFITAALGSLKGKSLLDIGCGLGEASVYFALKGASVTSSDLSGSMLEFTERLALKYGVQVRTVKSNAEDLNIPEGEKFDVVYMGNILHHVDLRPTLERVKKVLKKDGTFVSWDPLAYNPLINVYRKIATKVRTEDEHPLTKQDLAEIKSHFKQCELHYFWFFTLAVFIVMAVFNSPNKTRFWKKVVYEGHKYSWLYRPLKFLDDIILSLFPFLGFLCWNVVVVAKEPKDDV